MTPLDLATVFGGGLLTLLSPCVFPLIPLYLAMLLGSSLEAVSQPGGRARLLTATLAFSLGFTLVFTGLGLGASGLGQFLQTHRATLLWVGGVIVLVFGLKMLGVIRLPWLEGEHRFRALRTGHRLLDATLFGVVFALGWTPCVGPILGSVLTYTASRTAEPLVGALYLATYSAGLALPLLIIGFASDRLLPWLTRMQRHLPRLEKATGLALGVLGLWLVFTASSVPAVDASVPPVPAVASDGRAIAPLLGLPSAQPRFVEFYTPNCPSCRELAPHIATLRQELQDQPIEVLQLDASDPRNRQVVQRYRVSAVPAISLLAADGREMRRVVGARSLDSLRDLARELVRPGGRTTSERLLAPASRFEQRAAGDGAAGGSGSACSAGLLRPAPRLPQFASELDLPATAVCN